MAVETVIALPRCQARLLRASCRCRRRRRRRSCSGEDNLSHDPEAYTASADSTRFAAGGKIIDHRATLIKGVCAAAEELRYQHFRAGSMLG